VNQYLRRNKPIATALAILDNENKISVKLVNKEPVEIFFLKLKYLLDMLTAKIINRKLDIVLVEINKPLGPRQVNFANPNKKAKM